MMNDLYERLKLPDPKSKLEIYTDGNDQYLTSLNALYSNPCVNYGQLIKIRKKGRLEEKYKIAVIGECQRRVNFPQVCRNIFPQFYFNFSMSSPLTGGTLPVF